MIVEKTYICDHIPIDEPGNYMMSLRDYHRRIIGKIVRECNMFIAPIGEFDGTTTLVLFIGLEIYEVIEDWDTFHHYPVDIITNNPTHIGFFNNLKVYHDLRLDSNKIIFGSSEQEINQFITIKERRKKLEKLITIS